MPNDQSVEALSEIPGWVPKGARLYLTHVEGGVTIRGLARSMGMHASTVMRQVRRFEQRRDDPLVDKALRRLATHSLRAIPSCQMTEYRQMISTQTPPATQPAAPLDPVLTEAHRALRRLCESGAVLAIASDMEKAVVVRNGTDGSSTRTAVIDRAVAEAMALKDWISCDKPGRISRYHLTAAGRAAARALEEEETQEEPATEEPPVNRRARYGAVESPLISLARRRDKDGNVFLPEALVTAGERLREDFERGQLNASILENWDAFLSQAHVDAASEAANGTGPEAARARLRIALTDLGPGLADIALRCCCLLEGLEVTEKRMGWSARSGKIVLRIALQRLNQHYSQQRQDYGQLIG